MLVFEQSGGFFYSVTLDLQAKGTDMKAKTLGELAKYVGGRVCGDPNVSIKSASTLGRAKEGLSMADLLGQGAVLLLDGLPELVRGLLGFLQELVRLLVLFLRLGPILFAQGLVPCPQRFFAPFEPLGDPAPGGAAGDEEKEAEAAKGRFGKEGFHIIQPFRTRVL